MDKACLREFDGVPDQIEQDLAQPGGIADIYAAAPKLVFLMGADEVDFTKLAKSFPAAIRLRKAPDGDWVDAKSVVKVMGLKFRTGTVIELEAEGEGADAAIAELTALVARDFDESHG